MDTTFVYGALTAATAISSGFAGARAAFLSREATPSAITAGHSVATFWGSNVSRMQSEVREAISERCAGAQSAAAWLATSTALLGVASTRSYSDPLGIAFAAIGAGLVCVALSAMLNASRAAKLPRARTAFERWYVPWSHDRTAAGEKPTDDEIAESFSQAEPQCATTLRLFRIWPFPPLELGNVRAPYACFTGGDLKIRR
jgi:hypothetical protein